MMTIDADKKGKSGDAKHQPEKQAPSPLLIKRSLVEQTNRDIESSPSASIELNSASAEFALSLRLSQVLNGVETPNELFTRMVKENHRHNSKVLQSKQFRRSNVEYPANMGNGKEDARIKVRFIICFLALIGLALSQMSRMVMNTTITSMIESEVTSDGSCPKDPEREPVVIVTTETQPNTTTTIPSTTISLTDEPNYFDEDDRGDGSDDGSEIDNKDWPTMELIPIEEHDLPKLVDEDPEPTTTQTTVTTTNTSHHTFSDEQQHHDDEHIDSSWDGRPDTPNLTIHDDVYGADSDHHEKFQTNVQTPPVEPEPEYSNQQYPPATTSEPDVEEPSPRPLPPMDTPMDSVPIDETSSTEGDHSFETNSDADEDYTDPRPEAHEDENENGDQQIRQKRSIEEQQEVTNDDSSSINNRDTVSSKCGPSSNNDKFGWNSNQQQMVLGGFYSSYFVFMIIGGRLAEVYGAKYIIMISVFGSALVNLFTPLMARTNFYLLVASRVALGAMQSGIFPGLYALFAKWLTLTETSIFAPLIKVSLRLGAMLGAFIPGLIISGDGNGWQNVFYTTGALSLAWSVAWFFLVTSLPQDNKFVSQTELEHILKKKRRFNTDVEATQLGDIVSSSGSSSSVPTGPTGPSTVPASRLSTPWWNIFTSGSVVALIVAKLTFNYLLDFMTIQLPSYLKYVHNTTAQQSSLVTTPMFAIQVIFTTAVAYLAKEAVKRRPCGLTKTGVRKVFQGIGNIGGALVLIILTWNNGSLIFVGVAVQFLSFLSMFVAGGETVLPYDLSDEFPATIMAIANSIANISGISVTFFTAKILDGQNRSADRWHIIMRLIAALSILGGVIFCLIAKAERIDFRADRRLEKSNKTTKSKDANSDDHPPRYSTVSKI